jgi:cell division protein FtsL
LKETAMAAFTTTYFEAGRGLAARAAERNAELMAQQAMRRRGVRTPEIYFAKHFDNTRLVKAPDPAVVRQMRVFCAAASVLFTLVMIYGFQHFSAIEKGYSVESEKQIREQLQEENRQLKLTEAQLSQPGRIDTMARQLGLAEPRPGQMIHAGGRVEGSGPVMAQVSLPVAR